MSNIFIFLFGCLIGIIATLVFGAVMAASRNPLSPDYRGCERDKDETDE